MSPLRKGVSMLASLLQPRHTPRVPITTGELPITPEHERRRICEEQQERKRRLAILLAESSVFRQEPHEQR